MMAFDADQGSNVDDSTPALRPIADEEPTSADEPESTQSNNQTPDVKKLGKYEIIKKIGAGGMGSVFLARDTQLKRLVALKVLPKDKAANDVLVKRFQAEAQAAAHLRHDNIVLVYEAKKANGYLYIALEYVEGTDGFQIIAKHGRNGVPIRRTIEIIEQTAQALDHAFNQGIVHRDIKPSNLLISKDGTVKLADMGLARSVDDNLETSITRAGTTVGTVDYMAPEQARDSKAADVRSDIYSLGCTWYHMLVGSAPFPKGSLTNKLFYHAAKSRPDPRKLKPEIPEAIVDILHKMMARNPKDRHQTPSDLLEAIARLKTKLESGESGSSPFVDALGEAVEGDTAQAVSTTIAPPTAAAPQMAQRPSRSKSKIRSSSASTISPKVLIGIAAGVFVLLGIVVTSMMVSTGSDTETPVANTGSDSATENPTDGTNTSNNSVNDTSSVASNGDSTTDGTSTTDPSSASKVSKTSPKVVPLPKYAAWELPEWVEKTQSATRPDHIATVGRSGSGPAAQFENLNSAIESLPSSGGAVELVGDGPFFLSPIVAANQSHLWISAQKENRPIVVLNVDNAQSKTTLLRIERGHLTLDGIHLVLFSQQFPESAKLVMVEVAGGDLTVKNCSVNVIGQSSQSITAFAMSGRGDWPNRTIPHQGRIFIDNTAVQGNALEAVRVSKVNVSLVAQNSLFSTGTAAVLKQLPHENSTPLHKEPSSIYRFSHCSLASRLHAFDLHSSGKRQNTPWTYLATKNTVVGTSVKQQSSRASMLALDKWPKQANLAVSQFVPDRLSWGIENSLFFGWKTLVRANPVRVSGVPTWRRFWKSESIADETFQQTIGWPRKEVSPNQPFNLKTFDTSDLTVYGVQTSHNGIPGCEISTLGQPTAEALLRATALVERPILPPVLIDTPQDKKKIKYVDVSKLAGEINRGDHPNGTVFVVTGSDYKAVDQIRIIDHTYTIRFHDDSLLIRPEKLNLRSEVPTPDDAAFIYLRNGHLVLENIRFRIPPAADPPARWFLKAEDSSFAIKNSYIRGPVYESSKNQSPRFKGLVRWDFTQADGNKQRASGRYRSYALIKDSFLHTDGKLIQADMRGNALRVDNSLLVSSDEMLSLSTIGPHSEAFGAIDFNSVTSSSGSPFYSLPQIGYGNRYRFFVKNSAFVAPVVKASDFPRQPQLISLEQQSFQERLERSQVVWWEDSNTVASGVKVFADASSFTGDEFAEKWKSLFPAWATGRLLSGKDVQIKDSTSIRSKLRPTEFGINSLAKAAMWTNTGKPVGAKVDVIPFSDPGKLPAPKPLPGKPKKKLTSPMSNPIIEKKEGSNRRGEDGDARGARARSKNKTRTSSPFGGNRSKMGPKQGDGGFKLQFNPSSLPVASPGKDKKTKSNKSDKSKEETESEDDDDSKPKKKKRSSRRGGDDDDD